MVKMGTAEELERVLAAGWGVERVRLSGCGCAEPKATFRLVPKPPDQAELRWMQCSNCWGWPCVSVD